MLKKALLLITGSRSKAKQEVLNEAIWKNNTQMLISNGIILKAVKDGEFLAVHCKNLGNGQGPSSEHARILLAENMEQRKEHGHVKDEETGWIFVDVINGKFGRAEFPIVNVLMKAYGNLEFDDVKVVNWRK